MESCVEQKQNGIVQIYVEHADIRYVYMDISMVKCHHVYMCRTMVKNHHVYICRAMLNKSSCRPIYV